MLNMKERGRNLVRWLSMLLMLVSVPRVCDALVFLGNGDITHNTTAPTGALTNSGWQWQNKVGFCATAIGPSHLLTAAHLGVTTNNKVFFGGLEYSVVAATNAPDNDLTLFWVAGRLPSYAPIYRGSAEKGAEMVFHGLGGPRGNPIYHTNNGNIQLRGWLWTGGDGRFRWGTNTPIETSIGDAGWTNYLVCLFENRIGTDIITFSTGDSGGGVFIRDTDGAWKLAAVVSRVESQFRYAPSTDTLSAAIYDRRQFYEFDGTNWTVDSSDGTRPGTVLLSSRVSVDTGWIDDSTDYLPAGVDWPLLFAAPTPQGPFTEVSAYAVDPAKRTITAVAPGGDTQFFILKGVDHVGDVKLSGSNVIVTY